MVRRIPFCIFAIQNFGLRPGSRKHHMPDKFSEKDEGPHGRKQHLLCLSKEIEESIGNATGFYGALLVTFKALQLDRS